MGFLVILILKEGRKIEDLKLFGKTRWCEKYFENQNGIKIIR